MITNKKKFLKQVKSDYKAAGYVGYVTDTFYNEGSGTFNFKFVTFDDEAIISDAEYQLMIKDNCQVEFKYYRNVKLYNFKLLKSGNYRFVG